jgi:hypothetical protein
VFSEYEKNQFKTAFPILIVIQINRQIDLKSNRLTGPQRRWSIDRLFLSLDSDRSVDQVDGSVDQDGI